MPFRRRCSRCLKGESSTDSSSDYDSSDWEMEEKAESRRKAKREEKKAEAEEALSKSTNILNEKIKFFSEHTTMHGLDQVYTSGSFFSKWFWAVVLMSVLGIVIWQLWKIVAFFLESHTLTSISMVYPEEGLDFPSFTICTLLKLNRSHLETEYSHMNNRVAEFSTLSFLSAYSTSLMDVGYFNPIGVDPRDVNTTKVVEDLQTEFDSALHLSPRGKSMEDYVEDVTFNCETQFLSCWFENGALFPCCDQNTSRTGVKMNVKRYLLHSGACYEFESLGMKQRLPGPVGGFGFVYWYPNQDLQKTVFNSYDEHAIHLYTSPTEAMLEKAPVALQVGTHSHITLQATKMTRQLEDQLGRTMCSPKTLKYFSEYSYPSCQAECMIDGMLKTCNCTGVSTYANIPEGRICSPKEAYRCYIKMAKMFTSMLTKCRKEKCSEACTYWKYKPSLTVGRVFPPHIESEMIKYWRLPTNSDPAMSLIIADIYFPDIEYTDIQQMPAVTIESFISNIGGAMGLWTGASIITWIHLVFFCLSAWCVHREEQEEQKDSVRKASTSRRSRKVDNDDSYPNGAPLYDIAPPQYRVEPNEGSLLRTKYLRNSKVILTPPYDNDHSTDIVI